MPASLIIGAFLAALAVALGWLGFRRLRRRNLASALSFEAVSIILFSVSAVMLLLASNTLVYQRLNYEAPVARIHFTQQSPQRFLVTLKQQDGQTRQFDLRGDEWQLDARILKWHGLANVLGLDAQYRLHRLSGRYQRLEQARAAPPSVYDISEPPPLDVWQLAAQYGDWLNWLVDAAYGSAVYLPMSDDAEYEIQLSQSGLLARPVNLAAKQAVSRWIGL